MPKLNISEAAYLMGVSTDTLRRWEEELVKDVLEIITVFSAKLHSMRSRKNVALLEENLSKLAKISEENSGQYVYADISNSAAQ